nr:unnamed protein product [Callosobruchus chinensis]
MVRMSYSPGIFPKDWKEACIQPVPKKGSKPDSSNYRPIALLSVISKVMEKCVNQELMKYLELHQLINDRQYSDTNDLLEISWPTSHMCGANSSIHFVGLMSLLLIFRRHSINCGMCLEYCSHIWGAAAPTTLSILDAVQRRAIRLIGDPALTCHLQPLSHRRAVGDLSLF